MTHRFYLETGLTMTLCQEAVSWAVNYFFIVTGVIILSKSPIGGFFTGFFKNHTPIVRFHLVKTK